MSQRVRDDSAHAGEGDLWGGSGYRTREIQRGVLRVKEDGTGSLIVCGLAFLLTLIKTRAVVLPLAAAHIQIKKVHRIPCSLSLPCDAVSLSTNTIEKPSLPTIIP